uniref:Uncharacterized protein n=1 Tax=Oryza meridionalis TaxID=40149 RepID=A0A0E0FBM4_9ORYZ
MAAAAAGPAVVGPTAAEPARGSSSSSAPVRMRSAAPVRESGVSVVVAAAAAAASAEPVVAARAEPARGSSSSVAPVCTRSAVPGSLNPQPVDGARDITSKLKSKVEMALPSASSKSDFMHVSKKIRCSPRLNKGSASPELDKSNTTHSKKKKCAVKPTVHHNGPMGKSKRACKKELKLDNENAARVETRKNEFTMSSSWTIKEIENTIYCEDGDRQPGKPSGGVPIVDVDEVDMKGQDGHTSHELSENEKYSEQTKCNEPSSLGNLVTRMNQRLKHRRDGIISLCMQQLKAILDASGKEILSEFHTKIVKLKAGNGLASTSKPVETSCKMDQSDVFFAAGITATHDAEQGESDKNNSGPKATDSATP